MDKSAAATALIGSVLGLGGAAQIPTQQTTSLDALDATIAAPASHHIIFENDRVCVLRVTIPPGRTEPVHTHAWPSVMRVERPQPITYIAFAVRDGKMIETGRREQPLRTPAKAEWMDPEGPHAVKNRGSGNYEAIRVELKPAL